MAIREIFIIFAAMNTMKSLSLLLFALTAATCAQATGKDSLNAGCLAVQPLPVERLADLHIPRTGHVVFCVNGEVTVAGGHTSYDGSPQCHYVKEVSMERCYPYVFRTGKDDAIIFGPRDTHGSWHQAKRPTTCARWLCRCLQGGFRMEGLLQH